MKIKETKDRIIQELKNEIIIIQKKISEKHNDSIWYDGTIAEVTKQNGTELRWIACGEIRINNKEGDLVYDCKERNDGIKGGLKNDNDLKKIGNNYNDKYYWDMNNWFEVMIKPKGSKVFDDVLFDVAQEYDEALSLLNSYIEDDDF